MPPLPSIPSMHASHDEVCCYAKHIIKARQILEFGCGGSTALALYVSHARVLSIESDRLFIEELSAQPLIAQALDSKRLHLEHIDIGEVGKWGIPQDESRRAAYPRYSQGWVEILSAREKRELDIIFIDGRFRVACILSAILHAPKRAKIIVHDFFNREQYHCVLPLLECIEQAGTLGVFVRRGGEGDTAHAQALLKQYQYEWA